MFDRFFATRTILILTLTFFLPAQVFSTHLDSRPPVQKPGPGLSVQAMDALRNPPERLSRAVKTELENALKKAADPVLRSFFRNIFDRRSYSVKVNHLRNTHGLHFSARGTSGGFLPTTILLEVFHKGGNEAVQNLYGVWFDPMNTSGGVKLYRFPSADRAALSSLKQRNAESFYWQKGEHYIEVQVGRGAVELAKKVHASAEANGFYNFPASIISGGPGSGGFITSRLLRAIESGNQFRVERIIQRGDNVEGEPGQVTPLILAAELGRLEIINILLRAGAKPNTRGLGDINALVKAAENNHPLIVKKLINAGSETHVRDDRGATALAAAIKNGNANMLKDLLEAGADVNSSQIYEGERRLYRTPLMAAAEANKPLETLLLIRAGAKPDKHGENGDTPLMIAANLGWKEIVTLLLAGGADTAAKNDSGQSAIDIAERKGHREIVDQLLMVSKAGHHSESYRNDNHDRLSGGGLAQPDSLADNRRYPTRDKAAVNKDLIAAGKTGQTRKFFELLDMEHGDVNAGDAKGDTPLMFASYNGHAALVNAILNETPSDVNKVNHDGNSALTFAAQRGNDWVVATLLQAGADVNHKNNKGKTPLKYATEQRHAKVVQTLKDAGAKF